LSVMLHQPVQRIAALHGYHKYHQHYVQMSDTELQQSSNKYGTFYIRGSVSLLHKVHTCSGVQQTSCPEVTPQQ